MGKDYPCRYCGGESFDKCQCCCHAYCGISDPDDPCEGVVEVVDEEYDYDDWYWIHRCKKHAKLYLERGY